MNGTIIWTQDGCELCEKVKEVIGIGNYEERSAADVLGGKDRDADAMAQLMLQDMQLPIVMLEGEFVSVDEVLRRKSVVAA